MNTRISSKKNNNHRMKMMLLSASTTFSFVAVWLLMATTTTTTLAFTPSARWGVVPQQKPTASTTVLKEQQQDGGKSGGFSLSNLFGGSGKDSVEDGAGATSTTALRGNKKLEPHPSVRKHISPLNRLGPDPQVEPKAEPLPIHPDVRSGTLPNGLPYVILPNKSPPGRFEAHLQVFSGSGTHNRSTYMFCPPIWVLFFGAFHIVC
jgi:hypothetical protein